MKQFSKSWKSSTSRRKQHKYLYTAPLHHRQNMTAVHLSPELRKKHGRRSMTAKKGDTVKILRGQFKARIGAIERVDLKKMKIYLAGIDRQKRDGSKALYPLQPSNLMLTEITTDRRRLKREARKG